MTVIIEGPLCMKILLNKTELHHYFECYEQINYHDPSIKKRIDHLFKIAAESFEFEQNGRIITELYPTSAGGCIFCFTCEPDIPKINNAPIKIKCMPKNKISYAFVFHNTENMLRGISSLYRAAVDKNPKSCLYTRSGKYYLIIELQKNDLRSAMILREYSELSLKPKLLRPFLGEYFQCVTKENAVEKIGAAFTQ